MLMTMTIVKKKEKGIIIKRKPTTEKIIKRNKFSARSFPHFPETT